MLLVMHCAYTEEAGVFSRLSFKICTIVIHKECSKKSREIYHYKNNALVETHATPTLVELKKTVTSLCTGGSSRSLYYLTSPLSRLPHHLFVTLPQILMIFLQFQGDGVDYFQLELYFAQPFWVSCVYHRAWQYFYICLSLFSYIILCLFFVDIRHILDFSPTHIQEILQHVHVCRGGRRREDRSFETATALKRIAMNAHNVFERVYQRPYFRKPNLTFRK